LSVVLRLETCRDGIEILSLYRQERRGREGNGAEVEVEMERRKKEETEHESEKKEKEEPIKGASIQEKE
jgi:hypothetical protein